MAYLIFITGIDGSGKSYFSKRLIDYFKINKISTKHVWARFMNFTSKPLLGLCRILKLSYRENHDGLIVGYHDFEKSRIISMLFVLFQVIDIQIVILTKICLPLWLGKTVICERGPYDTFIDIMVDIKDDWLFHSYIMKIFFCLLPKGHTVFYLQRDFNRIFASRPDVRLDKNLNLREKLYVQSMKTFNWKIIDNNRVPDDVLSEMIEYINKLSYQK